MKKIYLNIGFAFLVYANSSFAQMTYAGMYDSTIHFRTVYNPPRLLANHDTLVVDANNDGTNDILFRTAVGQLSMTCYGGASYISAAHSNCYLGSNNSSFVEPYFFSYGDSLIKSDTSLQYLSVVYPFEMAIAIYIPPCANYTGWVNVNNYIGFRILNAPDTSYGWAEPFLVSADSMFIHQIVCESLNPGTIHINNIHGPTSQASTIVYPNPFTSRINVRSNYTGQIAFSLFDLASHKIWQQVFTRNITLDSEKLSKGIYIYELRSKDGIIKKGKLVKH